MSKVKAKGPASVFGEPEFVKIESGRMLRVEKWSVRKAMAMGKALSNILKRVFQMIESRGEKDFRLVDLIEAIPAIMESCSDELAFIVSESLRSDDGPDLERDEILDTFTLDDFADVLGAIIQKNITDRTLGKWSGLLQKLPLTAEKEESPIQQPDLPVTTGTS